MTFDYSCPNRLRQYKLMDNTEYSVKSNQTNKPRKGTVFV